MVCKAHPDQPVGQHKNQEGWALSSSIQNAAVVVAAECGRGHDLLLDCAECSSWIQQYQPMLQWINLQMKTASASLLVSCARE